MRFKFGSAMAVFRSRPAALAALAAILTAPGALANELMNIEIVSNPGSDQTYTAAEDDNIIIFEAQWTGRVSVRGTDLVFMMGDEERGALCPQTGDCDTCPVRSFRCEYIVQPGDLDQDGISIPAGVPFTGSVTRGNSNINQANCTPGHEGSNAGACDYAGMSDNSAHKVDGGPAETTDPEPTEPVEPTEPAPEPMITLGGPADDDHGGHLETASLLSIGPPLTGTLDDEDDVDVFRIDLTGGATLQLGTAGPSDTRGELLDGMGALLGYDEDTGPGDNFRVTAALEPGVHYLVVAGAAGDYAVTALLAEAADQGGTAATSALLPVYDAAELERVRPQALLSTAGNIDPAGTDLDVFRLDVARDATVTARSAGSDTDTHGVLRDSAENELVMDDNSGPGDNFQIETDLDAGIYYLETSSNEGGPYRVIASGDAGDICPCAEAAAMAGDHGGSAEMATLLAIGPPLTGTIADADDMDVFRIDLDGSATLVFGTRGPTDTRGELLDGMGASMESDDNTGPGDNFSITAALEPGVYYLQVTGGAGDYAISAQLADAADQGGTAATSALLTLYGQDDLDRVRPQVLLSSAGRIDTVDDLDVFRIDVPMDHIQVTVRSAGATDTSARLLDSAGTELATDDDGSLESNFLIEMDVDAGIYYLEVAGNEAGPYSVIASGDSYAPCPCADDEEDT